MKRPSVLAGISFAFVVAVFAIPLWWGLKMALPFFVAYTDHSFECGQLLFEIDERPKVFELIRDDGPVRVD